MSERFGIDEYSRYEEVDGERYAIEPWPFWDFKHPWFTITAKLLARYAIVRWHVGIIHQHGFGEWWDLRKF